MLHTNIKKKYYSIKEISKYTSLPITTLYTWANEGRIPSFKIGRRVLFILEDIDGLLAGLKRNVNVEEEAVKEVVAGV